MFTILLAALAGLLVGEGSYLLLGAAFKHAKAWEAVLLGISASLGLAVLLLRRAGARVEPLMKSVEKHIAGGRRELALKALRDGVSLGRWNPLLPGQLRVQIGILEYAAGNLDEAGKQLARASRYPWLSRAYLGCVHFKRHDTKAMKRAFDTAIRVGDKEGVAYALYAHCLLAQNERAEAVAVLERGLKKLPGDHRLQTNLELAKEGKKLKVAPYGEDWSRFLLDGPAVPAHPSLPKGMRGHAVKPGFRQRPQRRR
jgi:tetratricopeptide (TPR) repeat protein